MKTSSIRIEGNIISPEIFDKFDTSEVAGQNSVDFGFEKNLKIKDEIARVWADAKDQWNIYKRRIEKLPDNLSGVEETRKYWIIPLLENLGYDPKFERQSESVNGKTYAISHRSEKLDCFPIHIMGVNDSLDKRRETGGPRMSPHALVQEYLNVTEHLYGIVTNGIFLRVLRDSGKLVRLSYLEFNLQQMLEDDLYAEFSIMYRLIHSSRMPKNQNDVEECIFENYHQNAIESGSRIREKLSQAVEKSIIAIANGFLLHPDNQYLRDEIIAQRLNSHTYFQHLLRFIYRILFLFVIEERDVIYPELTSITSAEEKEKLSRLKKIYYSYYSVARIRKLAEKYYLFDDKLDDLWCALKNTFAIFEIERHAKKLGIYPLGGDLFSSGAIGILADSKLDNRILLECIRNLSLFESPDNKSVIRVNYASLNVEEFGSVYEGLLEYDGQFNIQNNDITFSFIKSSARSSSGSHYTPEELVQPLIKHSLDYIIEDRLSAALQFSFKERKFDKDGFIDLKSITNDIELKFNAPVSIIILKAYLSGEWRDNDNFKQFAWGNNPYKPLTPIEDINFNSIQDIDVWWNQLNQYSKYLIIAPQLLLSIKVCDVACGSGHILLSAARRIAIELTKVRTGEDQPSPAPYRAALRDVINHCIYGVDKNPLAVELCKVALWLEAYNPGMPLSFLDHRIKCGDSIVGVGRIEELQKGIAAEAFKKMPGDDPDVCKELLKRHKKEAAGSENFFDTKELSGNLNDISLKFSKFEALPEVTLEDVQKKAEQYNLMKGTDWWSLKEAADLQTAQFFIQKTKENANSVATYSDFVNAFTHDKALVRNKIAKAVAVSAEKRFFHWFLEFPEVFEQGGFDCVLGNPPFLGGQRLSGNFGDDFLNYVKIEYAPAGSCDLVTYFFRRIFELIKHEGFQALISTNTIAQGSAREGGLDVILANNGSINFAIRSMRWPGLAAVEVSLIAIHKGQWLNDRFLGIKKTVYISAYLDDEKSLGIPYPLKQNENKSFQGSIVLGKGFILEPEEAAKLIQKNLKNKDVLYPYLNGEDLNSAPEQKPSRWVINFFDWDEDYCRENYPDCFEIIERLVKPERTRKDENGNYVLRKPLPEKWWIYGEKRPALYRTIKGMERVIVVARISRTLAFDSIESRKVFADALVIISIKPELAFPLLQNSFHGHWAWKYCTTMKTDLNYTPGNTFETYPFPQNCTNDTTESVMLIGEKYRLQRKEIMSNVQLGLTKTYNLFHNPKLTPGNEQLLKANLHITASEAVTKIEYLRKLHKQMDEAVLKAYGWSDINLNHDFYEVDYLPENDRIRYTISPAARKEVLRRLLELNHKLHEEEVKAGFWDKKSSSAKNKKQKNNRDSDTTDLFEV